MKTKRVGATDVAHEQRLQNPRSIVRRSTPLCLLANRSIPLVFQRLRALAKLSTTRTNARSNSERSLMTRRANGKPHALCKSVFGSAVSVADPCRRRSFHSPSTTNFSPASSLQPKVKAQVSTRSSPRRCARSFAIKTATRPHDVSSSGRTTRSERRVQGRMV